MAVMSAKQFKKASNIFLHRRRSLIIKDIDTLLSAYESAGSNENRKMKCLVYVYMMCKHYEHTKPEGKRGDAVQSLKDQVKHELDSQEFRSKMLAKAGGVHYSGGGKKDVGSTSRGTATGMSGGYTFEGILPQKNFVKKMRLNLEMILPNKDGEAGQRYYGASYVHNKIVEAGEVDEKKANEMLKTMPMSKVLDWLHQLWTGFEELDFQYLNAGQRLDFLVTIQGGRLYLGPSRQPLSTGVSWGKTRLAIYAMDTDERLFCIGSRSGEGIIYNHSSFLSGHPVICAGMLACNNGVIEKLSNESGHYKPSTQNLVDCVLALGYAGLNLQSFEVEDVSRKREYKTAQQFISANFAGGGNLRN